MKLGLRWRLVMVTVPILLLVIGTATAVTVWSFQKGYLEAVKSRLEAISTPLANAAMSYLGQGLGAEVFLTLIPDLRTTVETNKDVTNVMILDPGGTIVADPRVERVGKKVSPALAQALRDRSSPQ